MPGENYKEALEGRVCRSKKGKCNFFMTNNMLLCLNDLTILLRGTAVKGRAEKIPRWRGAFSCPVHLMDVACFLSAPIALCGQRAYTMSEETSVNLTLPRSPP